MRVLVLSDIHLEFGPFEAPQQGYDLVILAGDTHPKLGGVKWALETFRSVPVLYVAGNHEFYGEKHPRLFEKMKALAEGTTVHVLENEIFEYEGFRFFGATLWTDFNLFGDPDTAFEAATRMNDFTRIRHWPSLRKFQPSHARLQHLKTLVALRHFLKTGDPRKSVVITHHAPSLQSVPPERRSDPLLAAYASNLDVLIQEWQPALWIHGHLHFHQDYQIGQTRVLANPRGYLGDDAANSRFTANLVLTL